MTTVADMRCCPPDLRDGVAAVLAGLYDIPGLAFPMGPTVLDIGANVGAFTLWALGRWPGCNVIAFEPCADSFEALWENTRHEGRVLQVHAAVHPCGMSAKPMLLRHGIHNAFEHSLYDVGSQARTGELVPVVHPVNLPACDVLKVDTEGSERPILGAYYYLTSCTAVLVEWHRSDDRVWIGNKLTCSGFECVERTAAREEKWLRADVAARLRGVGVRFAGDAK